MPDLSAILHHESQEVTLENARGSHRTSKQLISHSTRPKAEYLHNYTQPTAPTACCIDTSLSALNRSSKTLGAQLLQSALALLRYQPLAMARPRPRLLLHQRHELATIERQPRVRLQRHHHV